MATWHLLPELPIRIKARGTWHHGDQPLHPRVQQLFCRHVVPQANGSYCLKIGHASAILEVEDTAFFVTHLEVIKQGDDVTAVTLWISDGAQEPLDPATLRQGCDNTLYCFIVRAHTSVPCRLLPKDYHVLALQMEQAPGDAFGLRIGQRLYPVTARD